jgi:hypothetical protein
MDIKNLQFFKNPRNKTKIFAAILAGSIFASGLTGFAYANATTMDCEVGDTHGHVYTSGTGYVTVLESEKQHVGDLFWTDNVVELTEEMALMQKYKLLKIEDNVEALNKEFIQNQSFTEYEYTYTYNGRVTVKVGGAMVSKKRTRTSSDWSTDPDVLDATGRARDTNYQYYGYKLVEKENGSFELVRSELVDDIFDIANEYPYFKIAEVPIKNQSKPYTLENVKD